MSRVYQNRSIQFTDDGLIIPFGDGFKISDVRTKPKGSNSCFLSVGQIIDNGENWQHFDYPEKFNLDSFGVDKAFLGAGSGARIEWTIFIPNSFLEEGYQLSIIGTGAGSTPKNREQRKAISVFFSQFRVERLLI